MIDTALITINECANDGTVIHLYCDNKCNTWIAYGISAYMICHIEKKSYINIQCGFSDEILMAYVETDNCVIEMLFSNISKEYGNNMAHLKFCLSKPINLDNYTRWTKQMKNCL